ncbi:thermostable hemolysin [Thalassospira lucentensis]|uniref:thermostable hemolysin n=1 Tax=Thalassospira lucentensis TaxID=168935 RepID=UPI00142E3525|nr:thermostable hemolysin [Thalassospira lucentensis]NIZ03694.1 hypothetical protein [Thalassospira lucentensis]
MLHLNYNENGFPTAKLSFRKKGFLDHLQMRACAISVLSLLAAERPEVETFIANIYADAYDAAIKVQYGSLMSVRDDAGRIVAALGFRSAGHGPLFLEQYLSAPIDVILGVPRHQIVEIGNLASSGGGASSFLFAALSAYLHHNGFKQAVVTGTDSLEKRLRKMGLKPVRHAKADPARLVHRQNAQNSLPSLGCASAAKSTDTNPEPDFEWGRYYDTCPHVLSGSVAFGYRRLQTMLGAEYTHMRPRLYPHLQHNGEI